MLMSCGACLWSWWSWIPLNSTVNQSSFESIERIVWLISITVRYRFRSCSYTESSRLTQCQHFVIQKQVSAFVVLSPYWLQFFPNLFPRLPSTPVTLRVLVLVLDTRWHIWWRSNFQVEIWYFKYPKVHVTYDFVVFRCCSRRPNLRSSLTTARWRILAPHWHLCSSRFLPHSHKK